jgi:phosphoketolase
VLRTHSLESEGLSEGWLYLDINPLSTLFNHQPLLQTNFRQTLEIGYIGTLLGFEIHTGHAEQMQETQQVSVIIVVLSNKLAWNSRGVVQVFSEGAFTFRNDFLTE